MQIQPAYVVAGLGAASAALAFLPYPWAHIAAGSISAGLTAWAGYHVQEQVRYTMAERARQRASHE